MTPDDKIKLLLKTLSQGVFEKEHIIAMALLSAIEERAYFCSALLVRQRAWWLVA